MHSPPDLSTVESHSPTLNAERGQPAPRRWRPWSTMIHQFKGLRNVDRNSLQFRLTLGVVVCSLLGLTSMTIWTQWTMQDMLISTHKQTITYLTQRFPKDLELYSRDQPVDLGLRKTINSLSSGSTLIWVEKPTGERIIPQQTDAIVSAISQVLSQGTVIPLVPTVYKVQDYYFILCGQPLTVQEMMMGKVFFAQDVTPAQRMLQTSTQRLVGLSTIVAGFTFLAIALYIRRALRPLRNISKMATLVRADDLEAQSLQVQPQASTEVKELAQTLNLMLMRLSTSWDKQRQFVSNVSHELRTPLTIVQGYLQSVLRRSQNLSAPQREALETATSEAARTVRLLEVLLDLARADSGYMHYTLTRVPIQDFLTEVVEMTAQHSDRQIQVQSPSQSMVVMADRDRLTQVVINLIDNAIKYSNPEHPITLQTELQGTSGCIHVIDRGMGIPWQQQSRIFERFYRVDPARSPESGGAGLGLSIVKTLVEGMGGQISVRSKPGYGSTFSIRLPLSA